MLIACSSAELLFSVEVNVHTLLADEEHLPFEREQFDLVLSNLSMHWVNDLPGTLKQVITFHWPALLRREHTTSYIMRGLSAITKRVINLKMIHSTNTVFV
jgi:SAM-dependent methyltransferase